MENYICIAGRKIKLSLETAENIHAELKSDKKPEKLDKAIKKMGTRVSIVSVETEYINDEWYIKIPLPNCNTEWTLEAFNYVKRFCKKYPYSFPVHYDTKSFDNTEYLYIEWSEGEE